jgi:hypothetical protein
MARRTLRSGLGIAPIFFCYGAFAYTPAGWTNDAIPYWAFTVAWVLFWVVVLSIVGKN